MSHETAYEAYIRRRRAKWGEKFDESDLDPRFVPYYNSGQRIKVRACGMVRTGIVGATTGWRPCFILLHTKLASGSSWTLGKDTEIVAVQGVNGGRYKEVMA